MVKLKTNIDYEPDSAFWIHERKMKKRKLEKQKGQNVSELEALSQISDFQLRKYLKEQISLKQQLKNSFREAKDPTQIKDALKIVDQNIQKVRMSGLL